jgi:hypothetical protein
MSRDWTRTDARRFQDALRLPAIPWLQPVLPRLGLPPGLTNSNDLLRAAADDLNEARSHAEHDSDPTITATVLQVLRLLAAKTSPADADAFQRWALRHFICTEVPAALFAWRHVLIRATQPSGGIQPRVAPPPAVEALLPLVTTALLSPDTTDAAQEIRRLAPEPIADDIEIGLDLPSSAVTAIEIIDNEATIAALRLLSKHLSNVDCSAITDWAAEQAKALDLPVERFDWRRYLAPEPTCVDGPSAFRVNAFD